MYPIICQNNIGAIIKRLQDFLSEGGIIKSIYFVEQDKTQVILLVAEEVIDKQMAKVWWSGYSEGMKAAL